MQDVLCILAGGRSSRFGGSKLAVHVEGEPMLAWLARRLGPAVDACWLNVSPDNPLPPGAASFSRIVRDREPFAGPLYGMASVLQEAGAADIARVTFLAADMPLIAAADVARMQQTLSDDPAAAGVMHRWAAGPRVGEVEPLPSVWRVKPAVDLFTRMIEQGMRGPSRLADHASVRCLPLADEDDALRWRSVNTREDMAAVAQLAGVRMEVRE